MAPPEHWPEMEVLVLVVSASKKPVSSTAGMQTSVRTSSLMRERTEVIVPARMREMEQAIAERDFESFGKLTMQVLGDVNLAINSVNRLCGLIIVNSRTPTSLPHLFFLFQPSTLGKTEFIGHVSLYRVTKEGTPHFQIVCLKYV